MRAESSPHSARRGRVSAACALLLLAGCRAADSPLGGNPPAPSELIAEAVGQSTIRVSWRRSDDPAVTGYELRRRTDLIGPFETIEASLSAGGAARVVYFDTKVEPNRYYGYQVVALTQLGGRSPLSNVGGAKTSPRPGLTIRTATEVATPESADADGFVVVIRGRTDTSSLSVGLNGTRLVSPLAPGQYSLVLRGLAANCATRVSADTVKVVTITDQGTATVQDAEFLVSCRDPRKASIVATLDVVGDTLDRNGVTITTSGIIRADGTPVNERSYFNTQVLTGAPGSVRFDNLRPGDYEVSIGGIDPPCVLNGERNQALKPKALAVDTVRFSLTCRKPVIPVDTVGRPFVLRHRWSTASARPGDRISLLTSLDLSAQPTQQASGIASTTIRFDRNVVRYDSARTTRGFDNLTLAPGTGQVDFQAVTQGAEGPTGNIDIVRTWYTVIGTVGSLVTTSTVLGDVRTPQGTLLNNRARVSEATLNVTAGGAPNQAPTAAITGPPTAVAGTPVSFSGSGSTDPDGSITTYAWTFGDGGTATGANVSHTFAAAGTFTVRLTVTDNGGLSNSRDLSVTVTSAGASVGTVSGVVSSPTRGALSGVTVSVAGGGSATTNSTGAFTIAGVAVGTRSLSLSALPAGCTAPAAQSVTVTANATVTANFTVVCATEGAPVGTLRGRVTRSGGGAGISGAQVTVQPTGGATLAPVTTSADGSYVVNNVPIGTGTGAGAGTVALVEVPTGCTLPSSLPYTGLASGGSVTVDVSVTCQAVTTGTVTGVVTRASNGSAIVGATLTLTPTGGTALAAVTTGATGAYTIGNVPTGGGSITIGALPAGCTNPGPQAYTGVAGGGFITVNIAVTCQTTTTGTVSGVVTRASDGSAIPGATVTLTPTGGTALAAVTTSSTGAYTIGNVPAGDGSIAVGTLPAGCTVPAAQSYTGLVAGQTVTRNIVVTCTPPAAGYPVSLEYGPITTGGPTGRRVQIQVRWSVGSIEAVALQFNLGFNGTALAYASRQFTSNFDFGSQNVAGAGTAGAVLSAAYAAVSPSFETGTFTAVAFTFNIATGFSGTITPTLTVTAASRQGAATAAQNNIVTQTTVTPPAPLIIP